MYTNKIIKLDVREKTMEYGVSFPFDEELIMLILGSGTKDLPVNQMAHKIVEVLDASGGKDVVPHLMQIKGVGESKALAIAAALELGRRRNMHHRIRVITPKDILPFVRNYAISNKEHFLVITLNGNHEIIQIHVVSVGSVSRAVIQPREIFMEAIRESASAMILCHNHPSGNCQPSDEDVATTKVLLEASKILGIRLLDHIIIDCQEYYSFMENDLLFSRTE
ncbi:MAG: DNA repair protein RadC [Treponema sp.]|nr:DNA repair protein RadC [Treponema sp.]